MTQRQATAKFIEFTDAHGSYRRERVESAHRASRAWQRRFYITESAVRVEVNDVEAFLD